MVDIKVECAKAGYHSGEAGGIVPETFRIIRALLNRVDDPETGEVVAELQAEVPEWKIEEAKEIAKSQGDELYKKFDMVEGVECMHLDSLEQMYLANTWGANLAITGAEGLPSISKAGNVVRASTSIRLSLRLAPTFDSAKAKQILIDKLTKNVPSNAKVTVIGSNEGSGWCMRTPPEWLDKSIKEAGQLFFGKPTGSFGDGGSIPFLMELQTKYPETQIIAFGL